MNRLNFILFYYYYDFLFLFLFCLSIMIAFPFIYLVNLHSSVESYRVCIYVYKLLLLIV